MCVMKEKEIVCVCCVCGIRVVYEGKRDHLFVSVYQCVNKILKTSGTNFL